MFHLSPLMNILYKLTRSTGKNILRDFNEIERLQSSIKNFQGFVHKSHQNLVQVHTNPEQLLQLLRVQNFASIQEQVDDLKEDKAE